MPARMCEHGELYDLALGIEPIDQCQECLDDYLMLIDGVDYYGFVSELPDDVHVIA